MTAQDVLNDLINMANDLGRTPTRDEFTARSSRHYLDMHYGTYAALLAAAGLGTKKPRSIDNSIFERNIERHLDNHAPISLPKRERYERTLFIGDTHFPFVHEPTLKQIINFAKEMQPERIVQVGDLFDMYSHAKFPRSHNAFTPKEEHRLAREGAERMWKALKEAAPNAKLNQIFGNHDARPLKRILETYPEAEDWIEQIVERMMSFDGVELISDPRQELELPGNVRVIHGYLSRLGQHRDYNVTNVVCGHTHKGGVVFKQVRNEIIWELNCGLVGDASAKGLSYTAQRTVDWTLGWGWLDEYGPRFIPAVQDEDR